MARTFCDFFSLNPRAKRLEFLAMSALTPPDVKRKASKAFFVANQA